MTLKPLNHDDSSMMINVLDYLTDTTRSCWHSTVAGTALHFDWTTSKMSTLLEKADRRGLIRLLSDPTHHVRFVTATPTGREMLAEYRQTVIKIRRLH